MRGYSDVIFRDELFARAEKDPNLNLLLTITREAPADARVRSGRIDDALVAEAFAKLGGAPRQRAPSAAPTPASMWRAACSSTWAAYYAFALANRSERYGGDPAREGGAAQPVPEA